MELFGHSDKTGIQNLGYRFKPLLLSAKHLGDLIQLAIWSWAPSNLIHPSLGHIEGKRGGEIEKM